MGHPFPSKMPSHGASGPHLIHSSLTPHHSASQMASRSVQRFFAGLTITTDRPRYSVCNNTPHLRTTLCRCGLILTVTMSIMILHTQPVLNCSIFVTCTSSLLRSASPHLRKYSFMIITCSRSFCSTEQPTVTNAMIYIDNLLHFNIIHTTALWPLYNSVCVC